MMYYVYSVYDNVAQKYGVPFVAVADKVAIRDFNVGLAKMDALIKKDYCLARIGRFDDLSGSVSQIVPECIVGSMNPVSLDDSSEDDDESQIDNLKEMLNNG